MTGGANENRIGETFALDTKVIGHRGSAAYAPENTLAGFREALRRGCRWVELDVRLSRDGVPVLMHDPGLERTTSGHGSVGEHDAGALAGLDAGRWFGAAYSGERLPRLDEALRLLGDLGMRVVIEIKGGDGRERETARIVGEMLRRDERLRAPVRIVSSFSEQVLEAMREVAPEMPRALLTRRLEGDWLGTLRRLGCAAVHARHDALTPEAIEAAKREGFKVLAFTVNSPDRARELLSFGVDAVITDVPDRIAAALATQ